jgi:hypothetical protein
VGLAGIAADGHLAPIRGAVKRSDLEAAACRIFIRRPCLDLAGLRLPRLENFGGLLVLKRAGRNFLSHCTGTQGQRGDSGKH